MLYRCHARRLVVSPSTCPLSTPCPPAHSYIIAAASSLSVTFYGISLGLGAASAPAAAAALAGPGANLAVAGRVPCDADSHCTRSGSDRPPPSPFRAPGSLLRCAAQIRSLPPLLLLLQAAGDAAGTRRAACRGSRDRRTRRRRDVRCMYQHISIWGPLYTLTGLRPTCRIRRGSSFPTRWWLELGMTPLNRMEIAPQLCLSLTFLTVKETMYCPLH